MFTIIFGSSAAPENVTPSYNSTRTENKQHNCMKKFNFCLRQAFLWVNLSLSGTQRVVLGFWHIAIAKKNNENLTSLKQLNAKTKFPAIKFSEVRKGKSNKK